MPKNPRLNFIFLASAVTAMTLGAAAGVLLPFAASLRAPKFATETLARSNQSPESQGLHKLTTLQLELVAKRPQADQARNRARYILASRALAEQPQLALDWLQGLDQDYPLLTPQILSLRARAMTQLGNANQAQAVWQELANDKGNSPAIAEALVALSEQDDRYGDQAIARFPSHPKTVELAISRLKKDKNNAELMMLVARHGLHTEAVSTILSQLVSKPNLPLQPEDWADVGFAHWEKLDYEGGAKAYGKAPATAKHLYRTARSLQLSEQQTRSKLIYAQVVQSFPQTEEAGLALSRLAEMSDGQKALPYWDQLIQSYPEQAPQAMLQKSRLLDKLGSKDSASQMRQFLLTKHPQSDAAAELRWELAEKYAAANQFNEAIQLTQDIQKFNPTETNTPRAIFWKGRWQQKLQQNQPATQTFETLLTDYPKSYYAWRAAAVLGLPVGDFLSVRALTPDLKPLPQRAHLPAASEVVNELYGLGQDRAAWELWQTEFVNRQDPSVAEQFTDGLLRLGIGDHLDGIYMIASLAFRDDPKEKAEYEALSQQPEYWYGLYPLPYFQDIQQAAQSQKLNPLLVTALIRQESRFMPGISSVVGARGLMQVMPETADWVAPNVGLDEFKLTDPLDNLKMGTWYLNYTHEEWDGNSMLAIASYNAGPGNVADWVQRFKNEDVDGFVEKIPFPETRGYVEKVFENYWNYMRLYNPEMAQLMAQYGHNLSPVAER
jgi:soluble lytic murein transglycosylase